MADLRVNKVESELIAQLKKDAIDRGRTLRDHILYILRKAAKQAVK